MIHDRTLYPLQITDGRTVAYVAVGESPAEALRRMWERQCVGESIRVLPCGCADWDTKHGPHRMRHPTCGLNGYQHEDIMRWMGAL
jgi:hypothetical protein